MFLFCFSSSCVPCVSSFSGLSIFEYRFGILNRIGGVMIRVLASSAVDRGFEPRSGQTKDYKIGTCCFSAKHAALRRKSKEWLARNHNNVSEWSDLSIRGLAIYNPTQRVGLDQSGPHHHTIDN